MAVQQNGRNEKMIPIPKVVAAHGMEFDDDQFDAGLIDDTDMYVSKTMTTETAHRLVDYVGKCSSIHGHSWKWEVTAHISELRSNGISIDFGEMKEIMKDHIHDLFDHSLVLCETDPIITRCSEADWDVHDFLAPAVATGLSGRVVVMSANPTSENLALYVKATVFSALRQKYGDVVEGVVVMVHETCTSAVEV